MTDEGPVPVDTGFIVFNNHNYPNLVGLFDHLGVKTEDTDMSFGVSIGPGNLEYEGSLPGLLAQPGNLMKPDYWRMLADLVRFYRTARHRVADSSLTRASVISSPVKGTANRFSISIFCPWLPRSGPVRWKPCWPFRRAVSSPFWKTTG